MEKFLVQGHIAKLWYMQNEEVTFNDIAFVMAHDEADAEYLFEKHWTDKSDKYSVYYRVDWCKTVRTI